MIIKSYQKGDIRDELLLKKFYQYDVVIHLMYIKRSKFRIKSKFRTINFDAFEPLVKISIESGIKKFIISSSSVYGIKRKNVTEICL